MCQPPHHQPNHGCVDEELERARPHLVVANRVPPAAKARSFWVEVTASRGPTSLAAEISADGYSGSVADVRIEHVLEALDRAEEELLLAGEGLAGATDEEAASG